MNIKFLIWAAALISSLVVTGMSMRHLSLIGMSYSESLIFRGIVCLTAAVIFGYRQGLSLVPRSMKTQTLRALIAGLALTFLTLSYNWLSAGAVSVLSNIDVPLLVILGPWLGIPSLRRTKLLSLVSILFLVWFVGCLEAHHDLWLGLGTLLVGSVLLCFGYLYIKKSMTEENEAITIVVPSVAIIVYGLAQYWIGGSSGVPLSVSTLTSGVLSGLGMFGAYYSTMRLYSMTDIATAEFPTLVSSIVIQPIETIFLRAPLEWSYLLSSIGFVIVTYLIMQQQMKSAETV